MNGFEPAALLAIVGLILVKEAGVPIPVPGDLVVIGAGVAAGRGDLDPVVALLAIVIASIAGGVVQYGLLRSVARPALLRLLRSARLRRARRSPDRAASPWRSAVGGRRPLDAWCPDRRHCRERAGRHPGGRVRDRSRDRQRRVHRGPLRARVPRRRAGRGSRERRTRTAARSPLSASRSSAGRAGSSSVAVGGDAVDDALADRRRLGRRVLPGMPGDRAGRLHGSAAA